MILDLFYHNLLNIINNFQKAIMIDLLYANESIKYTHYSQTAHNSRYNLRTQKIVGYKKS